MAAVKGVAAAAVREAEREKGSEAIRSAVSSAKVVNNTASTQSLTPLHSVSMQIVFHKSLFRGILLLPSFHSIMQFMASKNQSPIV